MAAKFKFDKEMLIKQRFWIMLGVAVTLTFTGIIWLEFVSADEMVNEAKKALVSAKGVSGQLPTQKGIKYYASQAEKALNSESDVWSAAFKEQKGEFKWSDEMEKKFNFADGLFATDIKLTKITKGSEPKAGPADKKKDQAALDHGTGVIQGTIVPNSQDEISFRLKTPSGDLLTFYDTPTLNKITVNDGKENKIIQFPGLKTYSTDSQATVTFQKGRYFGDPLTIMERRLFASTYKDPNPEEKIKGQIHPILQQVEPYDDKGKGVVQLKGWLYNPDKLPHEDNVDQRFINYVRTPWNTSIDFSKGAWIAEEDLWIQNEIYRIIGETNKTVSDFKEQPNPGKVKYQVFKNSYFELHLALLADNSISFTVKNLLNRRQRLDQSFLVKTNNSPAFNLEEIKISADPLMPAGDKGNKDTYKTTIAPKDGTIRKGIFKVSQVLTWETAAIKRIDQISIGSNAAGDISHGHRTFLDGLIPMLAADKDAPDDLSGSGTGGTSPGSKGSIGPAPSKGGSKPGPGGKTGGKGNAGDGSNKQRIAHDLWLARYVEVSEQSRRIPVAISLIIDQDHVDRVLTHFNNSKLRFLETQVLLNYYPLSLQPPAPTEAAKPNEGGPRLPSFPGSGPRGPGGAQPPATSAGSSAEAETNMEIVIYGIMTLYQRYPRRANSPALFGGTPAPGSAPPAAAAPAAPGTMPAPGGNKER